jgi:hypothetical protein
VALDITRTRSKRYVGVCGLGECDYLTPPIRFRIDCSTRLREHLRKTHGLDSEPLFERTDSMAKLKQPGNELPESDAGEMLGDYKDHVIVFSDGHAGKKQTQFGDRDVVHCYAWALIDGAWKALGEIDVFFATVRKQIVEAAPDPIAGKLVQGVTRPDGKRNDREWALLPIAKADKVATAALAEWETTIGADF